MIGLKPSIPFTKESLKKIEKYKQDNLLSWRELYKKSKIAGRNSSLLYRRKTGRISYNMVKKLQKIGIDLTQ